MESKINKLTKIKTDKLLKVHERKILPQSSSSVLSKQSFIPSHRCFIGMHLLFLQVNVSSCEQLPLICK